MDSTLRRHDRQIAEIEALEILQKGEYGILSMCSSSNEGYGVPLNFVLVENDIYFHCATEGSKLRFLKENNRVSFCVVGKTVLLPSEFGTIYESAIASGTATEVDGEEKQEVLMQITKKYSADYIEQGKDYIKRYFDRVKVIKLSIESLTGKARKH
jgi:nitroimidazol reductase NimA-like FMN-containing flavoprotein (pyridoxamine 5'-phosphate oxidase superfamily)